MTVNINNGLSDIRTRTRRLTIGLVADDIVRVGGQNALLGVADVARERDVNLLCFYQRVFYRDKLAPLELGPGSWDTLAEVVDGLILHQSWPSEETFASFQARFPTLPMVNSIRVYKGCPGLSIDSYQGAKELTHHLVEVHGYRRIAHASGPKGNWSVMERQRGYVDVLTEYGLFDPNLVTPNFGWDDGEEALASLMDERGLSPGVDFEAVVASNDSMALTLVAALQRRGLRVPGDVAVVGFDDDSLSASATPPLTTMRVPTYEIGRLAAEIVLAKISGEQVPDQTFVPARMMVRRSCGCQFRAVAQAALPGSSSQRIEPGDVFKTQRAQILFDMVQAIEDGGGDVSEGVEPLLDSFVAEMEGETPGWFATQFEGILSQVMAKDSGTQSGPEQRVAAWQGALSAMRRRVVPCLEMQARMQAEELLQQARVMLAVIVEQVGARQALRVKQQASVLHEVSRALSTTFEMEKLMDVLADGLPRLGIPRACLSLYEGEETGGWSRLMLAYAREGRAALAVNGQRFPSGELAPETVWPQERCSFVVKPLYSQENQLGFILCEIGPQEGMVYETLGMQISSALYGVILVQEQKRAKADLAQAYEKLQEHSAELARQKYILDTFMANVPDSIYFKDRDSRFTQVNRSLVRRLGVGDPDDLVGKSDFDIFAAEQAQPKYDQEQAIVRTGQALLDLEEPDVNGGWALTSKMPLRDEHGAIIGTFGISRDITALKQAQLEVAKAYEEIKSLNVRLREENLRMSAELDISRRIQQMVLPTPAELVQIDGLNITGYMRPAEEVGGDYYDILQKNNTLHIGIGDVTGHGLESGVLMLMTQTAIRTLIEHGETDPKSFLTTLNRVILKNTQRMNVDKTLTFSLVKYQEGELKIVGQHEELLVVRQGGCVERVDTFRLGFPLGLEADIASFLAEATVSLNDGESLVLYTDGITEAENVDQQIYGLDRLCAVLSGQWDRSAEEIKQAVVDDVLKFIGSQRVYDDITLVVLKR
ncbi:MAG: SpoIIE family protein phosphatase [Anaerolineae bacterium]|nr:SpoIIE family protein phosphatase [Anaerolineae bacterium]